MKNYRYNPKWIRFFLWKNIKIKKKILWNRARLIFDHAIGAGSAFSKQIIFKRAEDILYLTIFWRGYSKPRYEAPGLKSHQIRWSWCQIKGNERQNWKFVSIWSILQWKVSNIKMHWWVIYSGFDSVTRQLRKCHFGMQKSPNLHPQNHRQRSNQSQWL